jgi:hypothetical protein
VAVEVWVAVAAAWVAAVVAAWAVAVAAAWAAVAAAAWAAVAVAVWAAAVAADSVRTSDQLIFFVDNTRSSSNTR